MTPEQKHGSGGREDRDKAVALSRVANRKMVEVEQALKAAELA